MKPEDEYIFTLFFNYLKSKNKLLFSMLQKGISIKESTQLAQSLNFLLPEEVLVYFNHKNGYKPTCDLSVGKSLILEFGIPMPLDKCIGEYKELVKIQSDLIQKLPLFDSGGGDFLLIDCDQQSSTYKNILIWSPPLGIIKPTVIYYSLIDLLSITIRCFMVSAYYYDENLEFQIDDKNQYVEARRINPGAKYWNMI